MPDPDAFSKMRPCRPFCGTPPTKSKKEEKGDWPDEYPSFKMCVDTTKGAVLAHSVYIWVQHWRGHTVLFFKIYAVEIGHQFRARGIIRIGQDYISSEYEQVPMGRF